MDKPELLEELGRWVREAEEKPAQQLRRGREIEAESEPDAELLDAVRAPLSSERRARIVDAVMSRLEKEANAEPTLRSTPSLSDADIEAHSARTSAPSAQGVALGPGRSSQSGSLSQRSWPSASGAGGRNDSAPPVRRLPRALPWLAAAALAASAVSWFATREPELAAIARFEPTLSGGRAEVRSAEPSSVELRPGSAVTLALRPERDIEGSIDAQVFVVSDRVQRVQVNAEASPSGALRLRFTLPEELASAAGSLATAKLSVLVGRREALNESLLSAASDAGLGWQRFDWPLTVGD